MKTLKKRLLKMKLEFMSYEEAKAFIKDKGLNTRKDFQEWRKSKRIPNNFPSQPQVTYKNVFEGFQIFLNSKFSREELKSYRGKDRRKAYLSYEEAKEFIKKEGLVNKRTFIEWKKDGKKPETFPPSPENHYGKQFEGYRIFLGSGMSKKEYRTYYSRHITYFTYSEAKEFLKLKSFQVREQYEKYMKDHDPKLHPKPNQFYQAEFKSYEDYLSLKPIDLTMTIQEFKRKFGVSPKKMQNVLPYQKAKAYFRTIPKIKSVRNYESLRKKGFMPIGIPSNPRIAYGVEFEGSKEFFNLDEVGPTCAREVRSWLETPEDSYNRKRTLNVSHKPEDITSTIESLRQYGGTRLYTKAFHKRKKLLKSEEKKLTKKSINELLNAGANDSDFKKK